MKKILLLLVLVSIFIATGCKKNINKECCECKNCPECDMCCKCE